MAPIESHWIPFLHVFPQSPFQTFQDPPMAHVAMLAPIRARCPRRPVAFPGPWCRWIRKMLEVLRARHRHRAGADFAVLRQGQGAEKIWKIYPSIHLSTYPPIHLSIYLSIDRSIYLSNLSINQSIYLSIHPSIHRIYLPIYLSIYLSIYLFIYLSIYVPIFRQLNVQNWSECGALLTRWLRNLLRATTACTFWISQLPKVFRSWGVFLTFWLRNVRRATTACTFLNISTAKNAPNIRFFNILTWKCASRIFSQQRHALFWTSQLPKTAPNFSMFASKCASRHSGVQSFISHLTKSLRTHHFSEPTFRNCL